MKDTFSKAIRVGIVTSAFLASGAVMATRASAEEGIASVYSDEGTANGEYASAKGFTAAHKTLPFGTIVKVTSLRTGRSVEVRINDRGPYVPGRIIDLTPAGAKALDMDGIAKVSVEVISKPQPGAKSRKSKTTSQPPAQP